MYDQEQFDAKAEKFVECLNKAIDFRRYNQKDPYDLDTAVMVALIDMRDAFKDAFGLD